MKKIYLITLIFLMLTTKSFCQSGNGDSLRVDDGLYLGFKVGLPYLVGLDLGYLIADQKRVRAYINASVQTIILFNSANIGAGYFLGQKGFSLGIRYSMYAHILASAISDDESGVLITPEIAWYKAVGKSQNTIISFQLGAAGLNFSLGARIF